MNKRKWSSFVRYLRSWYHPDNRLLPWKDHPDPYHIWVSEVFLQQTQADRVVDFFVRFTSHFPTVEALSEASFEEALPYFRGLGFYGRLRRMLETSRAVVKRKPKKVKLKNGSIISTRFPDSICELVSLPGIGPYTARAIACFAFGQRVIAPDTNVVRIIGRYFGLGGESVKGKTTSLKIWDDKLMRRGVLGNLQSIDDVYPRDLNLNQALMDLGSEVCRAKDPNCDACVLRSECWFSNNVKGKIKNEESVSGRVHRSLKGYIKVVCGVLIHDEKILVTRRRFDQTYAGKLEFPGGKVEAGEDERVALRREFMEELGIDISVRPAFETAFNERYKCRLSFHRCRILTGDPLPLEGQEMLWMSQAELVARDFMPANRAVVEQVKKSRL
jgi:A/G-specific adenine glycosylase